MNAYTDITLTRAGTEIGTYRLGHGALIGRLATAALEVDDVRVSEAHGLISLREGGLHLLALRRRFSVDGKPVSSMALTPGLRVELAPTLTLHVHQVVLPSHVLALAWDGEPGIPLLHDAASLTTQPTLSLSWRADAEAPVQLWRVGGGWRCSVEGADAFDLQAGEALQVDGHTVRVVTVPLRAVGQDQTRGGDEALHLVTYYDTVHIHRAGCPVVVLAGRGARLVSELVSTGAPLSWRAAAELLWTDNPEDSVLRNRLDAVLRRLRRKLSEHGVRDDLVRADGVGHVELRLGVSDRADDRS